MTARYALGRPGSPAASKATLRTIGFAAIAGLIWCAGCVVPGRQQNLVSKPNMQFSDSPVFAYYSLTLVQIEPGFAVSGGAQATTCTACK